jgi:uncharacterized glyoxalase superfamily protein PhnB
MPPGAFIPELGYPDVGAAATWLCDAFGFAERLRIGNHRIQLTFGGGSMVAIQAAKDSDPSRTPTHAVMVRVENVDSHCERARRHGARVVREPESYPYGERQYTAHDPGGHSWTFSESIADVDPADWGGELVTRS